MADLLQRVETACRPLLPRGRKILVAVSGGLDSMTLLHALRQLAPKYGWQLAVAHFNHQLRGRGSDADERLVRDTAKKWKLPYAGARADVKNHAQRHGLSIEMAARKLRHDFFAAESRRRRIAIVALAHHADDQVELFFLRLLRGAGGEGLAGMKPCSPSPSDKRLRLVRPLLSSSKEELAAFARASRIPFREDATNAALDVPRNRVRNELLPLLRQHHQPALNDTVLRVMDIIGQEAALADDLAQQWLKKGRPAFVKLPVAIQRHILRRQLLSLEIAADFNLVETLRNFSNQRTSVADGLFAQRSHAGEVFLTRPAGTDFNPAEKTVKLDKAGRVQFAGVDLSWQPAGKISRPWKPVNGREIFDADEVGVRIVLRHWRPGDRFQPIGLKSAAKLQDLFTNAKVPRDQRHQRIVAVAAAGGIFWVQGLRIGENFKVTSKTRRSLTWIEMGRCAARLGHPGG